MLYQLVIAMFLMLSWCWDTLNIYWTVVNVHLNKVSVVCGRVCCCLNSSLRLGYLCSQLCIHGLLKLPRESHTIQASIAPVKAQKLFFCVAALMSLQLRSLVVASLQDLLQFFQLHQVLKPVTLATFTLTPFVSKWIRT